MAFRGRGGRWYRGSGMRYFKEEPFELFPDIELPEHRKLTEEDRELLMWDLKLQNYWKTSPYNLDEEKSEDTHIERYSDRAKKRQRLSRQPLSSYMNLEPGYFPRELLPGVKSSGGKKIKLKQKTDLQLDVLFEKLEKKDQELKSEKESEDEEKDEKDEDEESGDFSDEGDYEQNEVFDDDEDDFNMSDGGDGFTILQIRAAPMSNPSVRRSNRRVFQQRKVSQRCVFFGCKILVCVNLLLLPFSPQNHKYFIDFENFTNR